MLLTGTAAPADCQVGKVLRDWRGLRRMSQMDLALAAEVSTRHLSCVETGKSQPSRDMVARLAGALSMPLREFNALLVAAGYAPGFPESPLRQPALEPVRRAIDLILAHQEPYPAFVLDRRWEILRTNPAALRVADFLIGGSAHSNMMLQFFDPNDLRSVVANWTEIAGDLMSHLHEAVRTAPSDTAARELLEKVQRYPRVPSSWLARDLTGDPLPLLTVRFQKGGRTLRFFSTVTSFVTANDVTLEELRIECAFPGDDETADFCRTLAGQALSARPL